MNYRKTLITLIILLSGCLLSYTYPPANNLVKEPFTLQLMLSSLSRYHFSPKKIDDVLSKDIYKKYINSLDPNKSFFTKPDIDKLSKYEFLIDNELNENSLNFLKLSVSLLQIRIRETKYIAEDALENPFDFNKEETFETNADKLDYCLDLQERKERWRKHLKYRTMLNYINIIQAESPTKNISKKTNAIEKTKEKEARKKTAKNTNKMLERLSKDDDEFFSLYLGVIASIFDPHTTYLAPDVKENFDINMSGQLEGIGAVLTEEDGFIKVQRIIPGGAADRGKELKAGDLILKVSEKNGDHVDLISMRVKDAVKYIRGKKGTKVLLTVKKEDGQIHNIAIIRDIILLEETYAKYCLIKHDNFNKVFGYIKLPSFYRNFKDSNAKNASSDLRKILEDIKAANVAGVVLDLRNNGGGSLRDAIDVAGLFIKSGPIVQIRDKYNAKNVLQDTDSGIVYEGPLVVLLNKYSASASEIVAAALQDYHRAIIIGTDSSFGKGTVQSLIDLDNYIRNEFNYLKPFGSLKLTVQKFYRINGDTIQYKGVIPDIALPDLNSFSDIGEKTLPYSITSSTSDILNYNELPVNNILMSKIKRLSIERQNSNDLFVKIEESKKRRIAMKEKTLQTLNLAKAKAKQDKLKKEAKKLTDSIKKIKYIHLANYPPNQKSSSKNIDLFSSIEKDYYLDEALFVIHELKK